MIEALVDREKLPRKILDGGDEASVNSHALKRKIGRCKFISKNHYQKMLRVSQWSNA